MIKERKQTPHTFIIPVIIIVVYDYLIVKIKTVALTGIWSYSKKKRDKVDILVNMKIM